MYEMSVDEIVKRLPMFQNWSPCLDGKYIPEEVNLGMLSEKGGAAGRPKWCEKILIGDVAQDVSISFVVPNRIPNRNREPYSKPASWTIRTSWRNCTTLSPRPALQKKVKDSLTLTGFLKT